MRKFILPLIIVLSLSLNLYADNETSESNNSITVTLEKVIKDRFKRPKAPSRQQISCIYSDGLLFINFLIDEGERTLSVTNNENGQVAIYTFDTAFPAEIAVGELSSATIEISTSAGNTYEGKL